MSISHKPDFNHVALKIERAKSHIVNFDKEATLFFGGYPYDVSFDPYLKGGRYGFSLYARRPFPGLKFGLILGDAVHNLRSALDYLVTACVIANGKTYRDTAFPIARHKADFERRLKDKVGKAGPVAMKIVRELKPYSRGNRALFVIHDLDLTDKHRLIEPVACTMEAKVTAGGWNGLAHKQFIGLAHSARRKSQFIPVTEGYETAIPTETSFTGDIVFAPGSLLVGKPCVSELYGLLNAVVDALAMFEAAFDCSVVYSESLRHVVPVSSSI